MSNNCELKDAEQARELADALSRFVNPMSHNNQIAAVAITNLHRTLQQNVMRLFMECCGEWAKQEQAGRYDLRNEATVKLAAKIVKLNEGLPYV